MSKQSKISLDQTINSNFKNNPHTDNKTKHEINYFITSPGMKADRVVTAKTTIQEHEEFSNVFTGIGCFKGTAYLRLRMMQIHTRYHIYALQQPFKKEGER